jgi:proteasome accessory factor A
MDNRVFGLKNSYSVVGGQRQLSADEVGRRPFGSVMSGGEDGGGLLPNGGRLQLDVVSHPEYATPACGDVRDLVVYDKAGERILEGLLADAARRLREEGLPGDISVFKSSAGSAGNSSGCQETYLVERHGEFGRLAGILIRFLVTRQIICGAGTVAVTPRGAVYCLSRQYPQRAARRGCGVAAAARERQRPEHERDHHAAQGGRH